MALNADDSSTKSSFSTRIVSGTIGSIITSLVVTPLEVVKVRTQAVAVGAESATVKGDQCTGGSNRNKGAVGTVSSGTRNGAGSSIPPPRPGFPKIGCGTFVLYNGHTDCVVAKSTVPFFDKVTGAVKPTGTVTDRNLGTFAMMRKIFKNEGLAGLYSGLRPTLVMAAPNTVLYYTAYEEIVWRMRHSTVVESESSPFVSRHGSWLIPLIAGGSARLVSSTVTAPLEFIKTRQAAAVGQNSQATTNVWSQLRAIIQNEGAATLYRGLRPTLWRDVPFSAIYWLVLEHFRLVWKKSINESSPQLSPLAQTGQAFVNGALAGMIAATCTTPFDLAKTRQQTSIAAAVVPPSTGILPPCTVDGVWSVAKRDLAPQRSQPTGTFHTLRLIARNDGLGGLWRGNQARVLKVAPACAIMLSSYEFGKRILE